MTNPYDLIVIGLGSAGLTLSQSMAKAGFRVLGIDKTDYNIGGDCLNYGCIPSKALIHVSRLFHHAGEATAFGLTKGGEANIQQVMAFVKKGQQVLRTHENADYLRQEGVEVVLGKARFTGRHEVAVGETSYWGKRIVICTGSSPLMLDIPGLNQVQEIHTNESIFELSNLPERFLFIGAGPIACELGQAFHRLGSRVTLVNLGERVLERSPEAMSAVLEAQMEREGMRLIHQAQVGKFIDGNTAEVHHENGQKEEIAFDAVMLAVGQVTDFSDMDLHEAGIQTDEQGRLIVNDRLQTSVKHIYAAGDAAGKGQLSHLAAEHASIILTNFFSPFKSKVGRKAIPAVTYTDPELATFGFSKTELEKKGKAFFTLEYDFSHGHRAAVSDFREGRMEIYLKKSWHLLGEKILGGSIVAPHAGEMVQEFIMAQAKGMGFLGIMGTIHPYPTATNDAKAAFLDHAIGKLRPWVKRWLKRLY